MRVLHIVSYYEQEIEKGGVAKATGLLARGQVHNGADVTVFTTSVDVGKRAMEQLEQNRGGVRVYYFPRRQDSRIYFSSALLRERTRRIREFDVVHIHGLWSFVGTWGALAARRVGVPYVVSPQGMLADWAMRFRAYKKIPYWYAVERRTVRGAAWIHFATTEEQLQARPWVGAKRSKVIPIGLDLQDFSSLPPRGNFRNGQRISENVPLLAFVGRIHPIKGLEMLLRALLQVRTQIPEVILAIAGPDEDGYSERLRELARALGVENQICWLGTIEEEAKWEFLGDVDVFVLPSYSENFGLAAVEAMAVGCPVILGRGVNIAAQVKAYGAGWVVPTEPEALSSAIVAALRDSDARHAAGKAGQRLVAEWYDGETVARDMLKAYEECLG